MTHYNPSFRPMFFAASPSLDRKNSTEATRTWLDGGNALSESVAIGSIPLSQESIQCITDMTLPSEMLAIEGIASEVVECMRWPDGVDRHILKSLGQAFMDIVTTDMARAGIESSPYLTVQFGPHTGNPNARWHVDGGKQHTGKHIGRWAVSWGSGTTRYAHGPHTQDMIDDMGMLLDQNAVNPNGHLRPHSHGPGVVSRFLAHLTVHAAPEPPKTPTRQARVFMTATAAF